MRPYLLVSAILVAVSLLLSPTLQSNAQTECTAVIEASLSTLEAQCSGAVGSTACFGDAANAEFIEGEEGTFSAAGDLITLSDVQSISTAPFNQDDETWGTALVNVHANVPLALSERGLTYILLGEVELENAVSHEAAFTPVEPVMVTTLVGSNIRSSASTEARVIASASVGQELAADGLSPDRGWLRILHEGANAWISRQVVVATDGSLDDLPVVGSNIQTLMQSVFLTTGTDTSDCADLPPSMLVIQGPDGLNANITVNGIEIRFNGTIALRNLPGNGLQLITIDGSANSGNVPVPSGFTMNIQLSDDGRSAAGAWTGLRPITAEERAFLMPLEGISPDLLYAALHIPTQAEVAEMLAQINRAQATTGQTTSGPAAGRADCRNFRPTSPLDGLPFGTANFYWDGAPGATGYRVSIYGEGGGLIQAYDISALSTTFSTDTGGAIGPGSNFGWDVTALVDGQVACTTARVNVLRAAAAVPVGGDTGPVGPPPTPTACPWESC